MAACLAGCFEGDAPPSVTPAADAGPLDGGFVTAEVRPMNVDIERVIERAPAAFSNFALPAGAELAGVWMGSEGQSLAVARDGRFFALDQQGGLRALERLPNEPAMMGDAPVSAVFERGPDEPVAVVPSGGLVLRGGWVRRDPVLPLLRDARSYARWGDATLMTTPTGVYTTVGSQWLRLDRMGAAITDAVAVAPGPVSEAEREAYVLRSGGELMRLRVRPRAGAAPEVLWSQPIPGLDTSMVRATASLGGARYIARPGDLLRVTAAGVLERVRIAGVYAGPKALASAGPWLWMVYEGEAESMVARTDGAQVEVLARGTRWQAPRMVIDRTLGNHAMIFEGARAYRVLVEPSLGFSGLGEGAVVTEPRATLQVVPPSPSMVEAVSWRLDGRVLVELTAAPWGLGEMGAATREFQNLAFGEHALSVTVRYRGAEALTRTRRFTYASPLGRVPTFSGEISAIYDQRCGRCHSTGVARDLRGYERLRAQAASVADVVRSRRMPPDLTMDVPSIQIFTAWVAGGAPQ